MISTAGAAAFAPLDELTDEMMVGAGVWGIGLLSFTFMAKVAVAITLGEFRLRRA